MKTTKIYEFTLDDTTFDIKKKIINAKEIKMHGDEGYFLLDFTYLQFVPKIHISVVDITPTGHLFVHLLEDDENIARRLIADDLRKQIEREKKVIQHAQTEIGTIQKKITSITATIEQELEEER